jgi:hypothetical protein
VEGLVPVPAGDPKSVSEEKSADYRRQAIAMYQKILSLPVADLKAKTPASYSWTVDYDRLKVKNGLVMALAVDEPKAKTLERYKELLTQAMDYDKNQAPEASDFSIQVWEQMQPYLDSEKDSAYIQEVNQRFKDSKIKSYREPNFI